MESPETVNISLSNHTTLCSTDKILILYSIMYPPVHGKDFKTSNIEDADERGTLALGAVQRAIDAHHNPFKETFVQSLANGFHCKFTLKETFRNYQYVKWYITTALILSTF